MKRPQDKIKDLVEPQVFDEVQNVAADPARSLAAYRFTDATSDLIARWIDALADLPRGRGTARALAGARGVGKSHALAVFGALAASPELRSGVADVHVATSARRLANRRYVVVRVERGSRPTLPEELAAAFTGAFGGDESQWGESPDAMLAAAASRVHDATLVIINDTAYEREARVDRDDGTALSELAIAALNINAFVALALDDDIADASGINSQLVATYHVDYLDQDHLYRVVDLYLLRKNQEARAALHDIYLTLRATVPGFNWSEPRFTSLYPVHPFIADVAAGVRLYARTFAFLPFAAAAAARAVGRPALSLVLLDEVFDRAEYDLRKSQELTEAFAAYDDLATRGVQQFPVMQRLQAKLILKSLFILSLDGHGATAGDLCAALLLADESAPAAAVARVDEMLARFAATAPPRTLARIEDGGVPRYRLQIGASAPFDEALAASVEGLPARGDDAINDALRAAARTRFEDWPHPEVSDGVWSGASLHIKWRGAERPGRFAWRSSADATPATSINPDWEVILLAPGEEEAENIQPFQNMQRRQNNGVRFVSVIWQPAALTAEESLILRRLLALRLDSSLMTSFGEAARAAASTLTAQAERIWARVFMDDSKLVVDGVPRAFTDGARAAPTLAVALANFFAPLFEERYPQHPTFSETLGEAEVGRLMDGLFSDANVAEAEVQELIRLFALPLGLATIRGELYTLETGDEALKHAWVREALELIDEADGAVVPLETVRHALSREPYGLLREAQHLVLAVLVAQRRIQLVTTGGDQISRRTLGRSVPWEQIAGVCRTTVVYHNAEELTAWARLLINEPALRSIADPVGYDAARESLSSWLEAWRTGRVLENFSVLPSEALTTRAWNIATAVRKSFGSSAHAVEAVLAGDVSLEEGLQRVADAFLDSPETFARSAAQFTDLSAYTSGFRDRARALAYLSAAEPTAEDEIESVRRELAKIADDLNGFFDAGKRARFSLLWREFFTRYTEHYAAIHDRTMGAARDGSAIAEVIRGEGWREFEMLAQLPIVNRQPWADAEKLLKRATAARCDLPVRPLLSEQPRCACSFRLREAPAIARLPQDLEAIAEAGSAAYRRTLSLFSKQLGYALDALAGGGTEVTGAAKAKRARSLAAEFTEGKLPDSFSSSDVLLISRALKSLDAPPPVRVRLPTDGCGLLMREELSARLRQWLDDLPDHSALVEIVSKGEGNAA